MKLRNSLILAATLTVSVTAQAVTLTWTGTTNGAWNVGSTANWNGIAPVFGNTADVIIDGNTPVVTYGTWLGDGNRMVRSLTFSNLASQFEIRPNNNGTTARQLQFASNSGNATITVDSTVTAPIIIGALAGDASQTNNGTNRLDSHLDVFQNSTSLLTIRRPINQSGGDWGINKYGVGPLLIAGDGGYRGNVNIAAGTLRINNSGSLGTAPKSVGITSGATLEIVGNNNPGAGFALTLSGSGDGGVGALYRSSGSNNLADAFSDGLILAGATTIGAASGARFGAGGNNGSGTTTGLHTLTKVGAGQFDLRGSVTIGNVVVQEGFFQTQASTWNDDGFTVSCAPGTEFRLFNIGSTFPRDIVLDNAGIFSSGSADLTGDVLSGDISLTGANTFASGGDALDSLVLTGNVSETAPGASVTIGGARKVVLAGDGTYTGDTFVGDGFNTATLQLDGTLTSNIAVADLATIGGDGVTTGSITLAPLSNIAFDPSTTGTDEFLRAADVIVGVSDLIYVYPANPGAGVPTVVLRDGNGGLSLSNFALPDSGRATLSLGGAGGNSDLIFNPNTADLEWRNFSTNGFWGIEDTANNFQNLGTSLPDDFFVNDNVSFTDAAVGTVTLATNITAGDIVFGNTVGNDVAIVPSLLETLEAASISTASSGDVTISADVVGTTEVISNGTGTLILDGINTAVAPLTINSGTVQIGSGGSIGSVASPIVNNSALVINRSNSVSLGQIISGTGTLTQAGSGTTQLAAANIYTGLTTIAAGTLEITATGSIPGGILNNSNLLFSGNTDRTYAGDISGTGVVRKNGTHFLTLTGTNSFSGGLVIEDGALVSGSSSMGSGAVTIAGNGNFCRWFVSNGTYPNNIVFENGASGVKIILEESGGQTELSGTINFDDDSTSVGTSRIGSGSGTIVISGKMTGVGTGGYAKRNDGTVVITGTVNDYSGPTTIAESGTLIVNGNVPGNVFFGTNVNGTGGGTTSGTLAGSGLIGGNVSTRGDSNLSPGGASNSGVNTATSATLSITGNLNISLSAGGAGLIHMDLDTPGGTNDRINVGGQANIGTDVLGMSDFSFNNLGGLAAGSYTLISSTGGFLGSLNPADLSAEVAPGLPGSLSIVGNELVLTISAGNAYEDWIATFGLAGPDAAFDFDYDHDGIDNGLEWVLGGDPTMGDASSLYTVTGSAASGLTLSFSREEDSIGVATLTVEYGTTLSTWPGSATIGATSSPADGNGVTVTVNDVTTPDEVTVHIPASNAPSGKLFARLRALLP